MENPAEFQQHVEVCVQESIDRMYSNPVDSSIKFNRPLPAHEKLRDMLLNSSQTVAQADETRQEFVQAVMRGDRASPAS